MKKYVPLALLIFLPALAEEARAQDAVTIATYQIAAPLSETKDYVDKTSFRGFGIDFRKFLGRDHTISVGGSFGWNVFDSGAISETIRIRTDDINGDITGTQFRYLNALPVMFQLHYYFGDPGEVNAYVGTGVGLYYIRQRFEVGLLASEVSNWHFGVAPEFGVNVPLGDTFAFNANVRYNWAAAAGTDIQGNSSRYQYFGFNLGLAFYNDLL